MPLCKAEFRGAARPADGSAWLHCTAPHLELTCGQHPLRLMMTCRQHKSVHEDGMQTHCFLPGLAMQSGVNRAPVWPHGAAAVLMLSKPYLACRPRSPDTGQKPCAAAGAIVSGCLAVAAEHSRTVLQRCRGPAGAAIQPWGKARQQGAHSTPGEMQVILERCLVSGARITLFKADCIQCWQ